MLSVSQVGICLLSYGAWCLSPAYDLTYSVEISALYKLKTK